MLSIVVSLLLWFFPLVVWLLANVLFFLKNLAGVISEKNVDVPYSVVMNHLRCKLSFCLLRWVITCLRGYRASYRRARASSFLSECRLLK